MDAIISTSKAIKLNRKFTGCAEELINMCNAQADKRSSGTADINQYAIKELRKL